MYGRPIAIPRGASQQESNPPETKDDSLLLPENLRSGLGNLFSTTGVSPVVTRSPSSYDDGPIQSYSVTPRHPNALAPCQSDPDPHLRTGSKERSTVLLNPQKSKPASRFFPAPPPSANPGTRLSIPCIPQSAERSQNSSVPRPVGAGSILPSPKQTLAAPTKQSPPPPNCCPSSAPEKRPWICLSSFDDPRRILSLSGGQPR